MTPDKYIAARQVLARVSLITTMGAGMGFIDMAFARLILQPLVRLHTRTLYFWSNFILDG